MKRSLFAYVALCLCHCVPTMSLCCVVHTEDIKHQWEVFFCICVTLPLYRYFASVNWALQLQLQKKLVTLQLKLFVTVKNACLGLFIDKTCFHDCLFGNPLNADTPIIRTFYHVPLVSVLLRGFHRIFNGKSLLSDGADFFLVYFKPDNMFLLTEREIAEIEVPFGMSPNSFTTSWISLEDEVSLSLFQVSISCKSPWVKILGFPPPCCFGWTVRSVCKGLHTFSTQLSSRKFPVFTSPPLLTNSPSINFRKSSKSAWPFMYVLFFAPPFHILTV